MDLSQGGPNPFRLHLDQGLNLIHFIWPDRKTLEDRGMIYSGPTSIIRPSLLTVQSGLLRVFGAPSAPVFQRFARTVMEGLHDARRQQPGVATNAEPWQTLLFWDESAPEEDFTRLARSYLARGMGAVALRSDWTTNAVWASFLAGPYLNLPDNGEEFFDKGSLAIVKGKLPFLVNATGVLVRNTPGTSDGTGYGDLIYANNFTFTETSTNRTLYNTFYVRSADGRIIVQRNNGPLTRNLPIPRTRISRFEDLGTAVLMRGLNLEDMCMHETWTESGPAPHWPIPTWTRDVIYLRPSLFVVYDRTSITNAGLDQYLAYHFDRLPAAEAASAPGTSRYTIADESAFIGSVTALFPRNAGTTIENVFGSNKVYRLCIRPDIPATDQRWVTVFDAADTAAQEARVSPLSPADGNVQSGNVMGALIAASQQNWVVLNGAGDADEVLTGELRYVTPAANTTHVLCDLQPNADYTVNATRGSNQHLVRVDRGPGFRSTSGGMLIFHVALSSEVTSGRSSTQPVISGDLPAGSGLLRWRVSGEPDTRYAVEASSDLLNWARIATNHSILGSVEFSEPITARPYRFYRIVELP